MQFNIEKSPNPVTPICASPSSKLRGKKVSSLQKTSNRPKLAMMSPRSKARTKRATKLYRVYVATKNAFPNHADREQLAADAFCEAAPAEGGSNDPLITRFKGDEEFYETTMKIVSDVKYRYRYG